MSFVCKYLSFLPNFDFSIFGSRIELAVVSFLQFGDGDGLFRMLEVPVFPEIPELDDPVTSTCNQYIFSKPDQSLGRPKMASVFFDRFVLVNIPSDLIRIYIHINVSRTRGRSKLRLTQPTQRFDTVFMIFRKIFREGFLLDIPHYN